MTTYVLTVSNRFSSKHRRAGEPTNFVDSIIRGVLKMSNAGVAEDKIHTIRGNYPYWRKRFDNIERGGAMLSLRYWNGRPYHSKQVEFIQLPSGCGVGIQELRVTPAGWFVDGVRVERWKLAENDGLSLEDFDEWFKGYDLREPLAIIHFTKYRY